MSGNILMRLGWMHQSVYMASKFTEIRMLDITYANIMFANLRKGDLNSNVAYGKRNVMQIM